MRTVIQHTFFFQEAILKRGHADDQILANLGMFQYILNSIFISIFGMYFAGNATNFLQTH